MTFIPKSGQRYYFINVAGWQILIENDVCVGNGSLSSFKVNSFRTRAEAREAQRKIKEILKND